MSTSDIRQIGSIVTTVLFALVILSAVVGVGLDLTGGVGHVESQFLIADDGEADLGATGVENLTAQQSLGDAVELTGANDSEIQGTAVLAHDETWTVSTWAELDADAGTETRRALQLGGWLMIDWNASTGQWVVTYYDESALEVHQLTAPASEPVNITHLAVRANTSTLSLAVNDSVVATDSLSDGGGATVPTAANWDGRVEETRLLDDAVSPAERGSLYASPTAPVKANETARIMYDAYDGETSVDVYRTGSDLELSNASFVPGFNGQALTADDGTGSGDYRVSDGTFIVVDGGQLDGAPVVFLEFDGESGGPFRSLITTAIRVGGAAFILVLLGAVALGINMTRNSF